MPEFVLRPPVTCVITGTAGEVTIVKVEVLFLTLTAELWVLGIELFVACSKRSSVPASYDHLATRSGAEHHFLEALASDTIRQDPESVHAHTAQSGRRGGPEFMIWLIDLSVYNFVQLNGVA